MATIDDDPDPDGGFVSTRVHWLGVGGSIERPWVDALRRAGLAVVTGSCDEIEAGPDGRAPLVVIDERDHDDVIACVVDVAASHPDAHIVLIGCHHREMDVMLAIEAGVSGFLDPAAPDDAMVRTLRDVDRTGVAIPRSVAAHLVDQVRHGRGHTIDGRTGPVELTDREWEVLGLLRGGRSTREIADVIFVSPNTVRSHVAALVRKFDVADRAALVARLSRP